MYLRGKVKYWGVNILFLQESIYQIIILYVFNFSFKGLHYHLFTPAGVLTFFCPCYTFGKTAEAVGSQCCLMGFAMLTPFCFHAREHIRERIRQKKDLKASSSNY